MNNIIQFPGAHSAESGNTASEEQRSDWEGLATLSQEDGDEISFADLAELPEFEDFDSQTKDIINSAIVNHGQEDLSNPTSEASSISNEPQIIEDAIQQIASDLENEDFLSTQITSDIEQRANNLQGAYDFLSQRPDTGLTAEQAEQLANFAADIDAQNQPQSSGNVSKLTEPVLDIFTESDNNIDIQEQPDSNGDALSELGNQALEDLSGGFTIDLGDIDALEEPEKFQPDPDFDYDENPISEIDVPSTESDFITSEEQSPDHPIKKMTLRDDLIDDEAAAPIPESSERSPEDQAKAKFEEIEENRANTAKRMKSEISNLLEEKRRLENNMQQSPERSARLNEERQEVMRMIKVCNEIYGNMTDPNQAGTPPERILENIQSNYERLVDLYRDLGERNEVSNYLSQLRIIDSQIRRQENSYNRPQRPSSSARVNALQELVF